MEWNLLLFCLIGGVVCVDTDTFLQSMLSQPLIACTFVGLLFDNITLGLTVGMLMQLPFLAEIPVGGRNMSFGNLGAYVASGLAIFFSEKINGSQNIILIAAILWGTAISYITSPLLKYRRNFNLVLVRKADQAVKRGRLSEISLYQYCGVMAAFIFGVVYCWIFFEGGERFIIYVMYKIPAQMENKLVLIKPILLGAGIGAMMYGFINKKSFTLAGIGVVAGAAFFLLKSYF